MASLASLYISTDEEQYPVLDGKGEVDELPLRLAGSLGPARAVATGKGIGSDLNTEVLNIEFNTKPRKGVGVSADMFVTPFVKVVGTLASSRIGVDNKARCASVLRLLPVASHC